jgi:Coenzyme PQQ synthesis protein D (PqqD)
MTTSAGEGRDPSRVRLRPGALSWREVEGEIVAVENDEGVYLATNGSGALLWRMLADGASIDELCAELASEFGLGRELAMTHVQAFLTELDARNLLDRGALA